MKQDGISTVRSTKCIKFNHTPNSQLKELLNTFKKMCNEAIGIANQTRPKSRFALHYDLYPKLKKYGLHTRHYYGVCEVAYSMYKNKNRKKKPYVTKPFIKLDNLGYKRNGILLQIPVKPRQYITIPLTGSDYHWKILNDPSLKMGSVTLSERTISIAVTKTVSEIEPVGQIGIDVNERNITTSDTLGNTTIFDISKVPDIKQRYKEIKSRFQKRKQDDKRIKTRLQQKYGQREKNRIDDIIHKISKEVVTHAKQNNLEINMEKLKGIRKLYRKGNGQGSKFRFRMNSWVFAKIQKAIDYKASWEGVPVNYINPRKTSQNCSTCNSHLEHLLGRKFYCRNCNITWDRDVNASKNIMSVPRVPQIAVQVVRSGHPSGAVK